MIFGILALFCIPLVTLIDTDERNSSFPISDLIARISTVHDVIVYGNFSRLSIDISSLTRGHLLANQPENNFESFTGDDPLISIISSPNLTHLSRSIFKIAQFLTSSPTLPRTRYLFFLLWPLSGKDQVDILFKFLDSIEIQKYILLIPQDSHVYLVVTSTSIPRHHNYGEIAVPHHENEIQFELLVEIYGINRTLPIIQPLNLTHQLENNNLFNIINLIPFTVRRSDFKGVNINVLAQADPDFIDEVDIEILDSGEVKIKSGAVFKILKDFQTALKFRYTAVSGKGWMKEDDNGVVTGVGKQILGHEADLSISLSVLSYYRALHVQFLPSIETDEPRIFFLQPPVSSSRNIYVLPFTSTLWLVAGLIWALIGLTALFISLYKKRALGFEKGGTAKLYSKHKKREFSNLSYIITWAICFLCQQGWYKNVECRHLRIVFITGMLTSVILYGSYTATLVAVISMPNIPIKQYSDFSKQGFQTFVDPHNFIFAATFVSDTVEKTEVMRRSNSLYVNDEKAVDLMMEKESKMAFMTTPIEGFYPALMRKYKAVEVCQVDSLMGRKRSRVNYAMIIPKGSDYFEFFKVQTVRLIERGLNERYFLDYRRKAQPRCLQFTREPSPHTFLACYPAFKILTGGYLFGSAILLFEKLAAKFINNFR